MDNDDLWELEGENRSAAAFDEFVVHYERHDKSIIKGMATAYGGRFFLCGLATLFSTACNVFAPAVLNHVRDGVCSTSDRHVQPQYLARRLLRLETCNAIVTIVILPRVDRVATNSDAQGASVPEGHASQYPEQRRVQDLDISNLFSELTTYCGCLPDQQSMVIPLQIAVVVYMLYAVIDLAAFAGLGVIAVSMLEVFNAIQIVKLNAWEDKFADKIQKLRATELSAVKKFMYLGALIFCLPASRLAHGYPDLHSSQGLLDRFSDYSPGEFTPTNVIRHDPAQPDDVVMALRRRPGEARRPGDRARLVGSGSRHCAPLCREMDKLAGSVFVRGSVAYYSQQTWIQNMTIRDNILFGLPYDKEKYSKVIAACGLLPDLKQFPGGDLTEIGQKGVNLSGGQKARAVILVTHSADIIASKAANLKVLVEDGKLTATRHDVALPRSSFRLPASPRSAMDEASHDGDSKKNDAGRLVDDEEREEGRVSKEVFANYFDSLGGVKVCIFLFAVQTLWQVFQIGSDLWLSHWTGQKGGSYNHNETAYNVKVYSLLGAGAAVMVFVRSATVAVVGLRASRHLFDNMTVSLLKAPLRFFDANPIGRIVNRYGDDMSAVDFMIPFAFGGFLAMFFFTQAWFAETVTSQWFQVRMQLLGCGVIFLVVSGLVYLRNYLSPGIVGLAFTYALSVDSGLADLVQSWSGSRVVFSYKPGAPPVLKGLSFNIRNNEKIGIVGRTGAGKSSLTMALFRINELVSGRILIDGTDIATMPYAHYARTCPSFHSHPSVQGNVASLHGPVRRVHGRGHLERTGEGGHEDAGVELEGQLSYELSENGENFSVGERQMLCMARALLTRSRIVVMDEATASIDHETEKKLQQMINRDFQDATC
ncbi:P-loop containing nucleoside triphosphate hydrolase [Phytophthora cactorum]|nr:P-loop containing nucleoside triphosphate hydrolase [Phytophthora cactorum]